MNSRAVKNHGQNWEDSKLGIHRFYILENNTLDVTIAKFRDTYGLRARERRWKEKLAEWGFNKYTKKRKRAAVDRAAISFHGDTRNTGFKRRKTIEVSADVDKAIPQSIQCSTPDLDDEGDLSENMFEQDIPYTSYNSAMPEVSRSHADSAWSAGSEKGKTMQEESLLSMLDHDDCLWGDVQPFSPYELSHQLGSHEIAMVKLRDKLSSITECLRLPDDPRNFPALCCADNSFRLGPYIAIGRVKEVDETNSEVVALEELFSLTVMLAKHQQEYGEFAEPTLEREFELAKAEERNNLLKEAEYHCRRILGKYPYANVQLFLGLILARSVRLKESSSLLFNALAGFIVDFKEFSYNENTSMFQSIKLLYAEVTTRSELDWTSTTSCLCRMMTRIQNSQTDRNPQQLFSQLLIHGFSFAHECAILGMVDPAKQMYQALFKPAILHLDFMHHGMEMANAYQKYGTLLRMEKEWKLSADQLQLACECVARAGSHNSHFITLLEDNYNQLLPHLTAEPNGETLAEILRKALDRIAVPLHLQDNKAGTQVSRITQYLLSDSPLSRLDSLVLPHVAGLELSSRAVEFVQGDGEYTSTWSTIESRNLGETMSEGQITGISDSYLWPRSVV